MPEPVRLEVLTSDAQHLLHVPEADSHVTLAEVLRRHDLPLNTRCGQRGLCDGCLVEMLAGELVHGTSGQRVTVSDAPLSVRACEHRITHESPLRLRIPARSLLAYEPEVLTDFRLNVPRALNPLWQQVEVAATDVGGDVSRAEWLCARFGRFQGDDAPVRASETVAEQLEAWDGVSPRVATFELQPDGWLAVETACEREASAWGAAIDVGTTTVVVSIVELATGRIVSHASGFNRQITLGDDVLTRINLCITDPAVLEQLQEAVVQRTIRRLVAAALQHAGEPHHPIVGYAVSGNTTMLHLLAGVDPSPMGYAPFTPRFLEHRVLAGRSIRLEDEVLAGSGSAVTVAVSAPPEQTGPFRTASPRRDAPVHLLPGAAAYVGADLCAGILSSGLLYDEGPSLLVDVGTNGEIILKQQDRLSGCATAAGPAFEGSRLTCGMRAGSGAISHVRMVRRPLRIDIDVLGKEEDGHRRTRPHGLCGSGYIDVLAEARRNGLLASAGRFCSDFAGDGEGMADYLVAHETAGRALRIAMGVGHRPIVVTESDISLLLQAKAAIAAGILTLLEREGLVPSQVRTLYLAGGFGMFLDVPNAIACGLLPGFVPEQVQLVGNTSLAGAYLALLDSGALKELSRIAKRLDVVELNLDPGFEGRYIDQLALP